MLGRIVEPEAVNLPVDLSVGCIGLHSVKAAHVSISGLNLIYVVGEAVVSRFDSGGLPDREK